MTEDKKKRVATAVGFLSGVLACLDALREKGVFWPPDVVWRLLRNSQKLELAGGIALIVVTIVISVANKKS